MFTAYCLLPTASKGAFRILFKLKLDLLVPFTLGRVVIVTSVRGLLSFPANSAYQVTKHGLETMADSLRLEMLKFGVKVSVVEPANYSMATGIQNDEHV